MYEWFDDLTSLALDRTPDELIGALVFALGLSLAGATAGVRLCRSRPDASARMTAVLLVVIAVAMGTSAAFVRRAYDPMRRPMASAPPPDPDVSRRMTALLDADRDGRVSDHELHRAAVALAASARRRNAALHGSQMGPGPRAVPEGRGGPGPWPGPWGHPSPTARETSPPARDLQSEAEADGDGPTRLSRLGGPVSTTELQQ